MKARPLYPFACLFALAGGLGMATLAATSDEPSNAPLARNEPHHHVLFQNEFVRIFRVVIAAGDATLWHEHNFDFGGVFVNGSKVRANLRTEPNGTEATLATKSFFFSLTTGSTSCIA